MLGIGDASSIRPAVVFAENWYHPSLGTDPAQDIHGPPKEGCRRQCVQDDKDGVTGGILSTNKAKFWNKSQANGYGHAEVDIAGGEKEYEERPLHGPSASGMKRRVAMILLIGRFFVTDALDQLVKIFEFAAAATCYRQQKRGGPLPLLASAWWRDQDQGFNATT